MISAHAVTDRVYDAIRDRILSGDMEPGAFVRQEEISQAMGVSRTPVREALMRLVSEGHVQRVHRRGFRIAEQSVGDLLALYPILTALETLACKDSFPALGADDVAQLQRLNKELARLSTTKQAALAVRVNQRFHQVLAARCANRRLVALLDDLSSEVARLEIWSFASEASRRETLDDHAAIIAALARKDYSAALKSLARDRMSAHREYAARVDDPPGSSPAEQRSRSARRQAQKRRP